MKKGQKSLHKKKTFQQLVTHTSQKQGSVQRSLKWMKIDCAAQVEILGH